MEKKISSRNLYIIKRALCLGTSVFIERAIIQNGFDIIVLRSLLHKTEHPFHANAFLKILSKTPHLFTLIYKFF